MQIHSSRFLRFQGQPEPESKLDPRVAEAFSATPEVAEALQQLSPEAKTALFSRLNANTTTNALAREGIFDTSELRPLSPAVKTALDRAVLRIPTTHRGIVVRDSVSQSTLRLENRDHEIHLLQFPAQQGKRVYRFNPAENTITASAYILAATPDTPIEHLTKPTLDLSDANLIALLNAIQILPIAHQIPA